LNLLKRLLRGSGLMAELQSPADAVQSSQQQTSQVPMLPTLQQVLATAEKQVEPKAA
jgi:hypothetical protein